jgi:hypothetical protein
MNMQTRFSFSLLSFMVLVVMMPLNGVVADQFIVFDNFPNFNATSVQVEQTLHLLAAVAVDFTEISTTTTGGGGTEDNLSRHLRGGNNKNEAAVRRLPCGTTCYQCKTYYGNSKNYCQVYCGLSCSRRGRELYPVIYTNPMDAFNSCVKEAPDTLVAEATAQANQMGITSLANGLDPSQGNVEIWNCV